MKTSMGVMVVSVGLFAAACAAAPPVNPGGPGHLPPPAPAGFDNASDGLVEAVDDSALIELSRKQCKETHGRICGLALYVPVVESPGTTRIGRFGWKDQHASLLSFSGDAYINEMGITNALFPDEVTKLCNTVSEPNNTPEADGLGDIDHFTS